VIQLLPINDTSKESHFSPFASRSSFALNPLNISLWKIECKNDSGERVDASKVDEALWNSLKELNNADRIDWGEGKGEHIPSTVYQSLFMTSNNNLFTVVRRVKMEWLRKCFASYQKETSNNADYTAFIDR